MGSRISLVLRLDSNPSGMSDREDARYRSMSCASKRSVFPGRVKEFDGPDGLVVKLQSPVRLTTLALDAPFLELGGDGAEGSRIE